MLSQKNVSNALFKYLYDNLDSEGVKIFDSVHYEDFSGLTKWVVLQPLTNTLGVNPKQLYFIHCAVSNTGETATDDLNDLLDLVIPLLDEYTVIDVFAYPDDTNVVGAMMVSECSLGPQLAHSSGGVKQTLSVGFVYEGF